MSLSERRPSRRAVLRTGTGAAALLAAPAYLRAQPAAVKIGILQPVTGALAQDGELGRTGAELAINEINASGGIKALGGAKLEMVFGDARSNPEAGTQEVERMQADGVAAIVGGFASPICLAATQAAARYDLPYIVDVGVSDQITQSRPEEHLPLRPRLRHRDQRSRVENLTKLNDGAGKPAKTVVLVHEDRLFGSGLAKLMQTRAAEARLRDPRDDRASDAGARHVERRAAHPLPQPGPRHPVELLRRVRAARPHHAAAAHPAEGRLRGAQRRGLELPLREGVSRTPPPTSWTAITGTIRAIPRPLR